MHMKNFYVTFAGNRVVNIFFLIGTKGILSCVVWKPVKYGNDAFYARSRTVLRSSIDDHLVESR